MRAGQAIEHLVVAHEIDQAEIGERRDGEASDGGQCRLELEREREYVAGPGEETESRLAESERALGLMQVSDLRGAVTRRLPRARLGRGRTRALTRRFTFVADWLDWMSALRHPRSRTCLLMPGVHQCRLSGKLTP